MRAKWLAFLLGLGFFIGEGSRSVARNDDRAILHRQVLQLYQEGKYQEAILIAEKLLVIEKRVLGPENPETATTLNNLGSLYAEITNYAKAEPLLEQALQIRKKVLGPEDPDIAANLNDLAVLYEKTADYPKAEPLLQEALQIREKVLGPEDPDIAANLNDLGVLFEKMGNYPKAETHFQQALQIRKKVLGPEHRDTATTLDGLAGLYEEMADYAKAETLYQQVLQINKKSPGPTTRDTARSLNNLAALYREMGDYTKAEPLYQQALQIDKKVLGPENPAIAASLNNLAVLYDDVAHYAKAEPLFQQALQIMKKALGPVHPDTAKSLNNLARHYVTMGDYSKAEPLYQQVIQIRNKALGPEHQDTAESLGDLGQLYEDMGDYPKAEPLLQQALQIRQKVFGPEHLFTAIALDNLAVLYKIMGEYAKAELLYQQALQIMEKALGPDNRETAAGLSNLAALYDEMGDYAKAEPLYQQALQIMKKVLGEQHPDRAKILNNLAALYLEMGDYAQAEPLFQQALQIQKKVLGEQHPDTAQSLNNLATLYLKMEDYAKAEPLFRQALQICTKVLGPEHSDTATDFDNLGLLYLSTGDYAKAEPLIQQALEIDRKVLGPEHPDTATCIDNLGLVKFYLGQTVEAKSLEQMSARTRLAIFAKILSFTSEEQRFAFQDTLNPYSLFAALKGSAEDLAAAILRYKGVVLDSIIEDRVVAEASKETQDRDLVGRLAAQKRELGQLLLQNSNRLSGQMNKRIEDLEREVEQIEGALAQHVSGLGHARRALGVSVAQVQAVIPRDGLLIEYLQYEQFLGKGAFEPSYGAIVLAASGPPRWIPLANAKDVDANVSRYQTLVRSAFDPSALSESLETLHRQLWDPIELVLPPGVKRVIISPDSQLNFVSFATLLDSEKRFLAEKYTFQYVASGRDLIREIKPSTSTAAIIFANPDFTFNQNVPPVTADGTLSRTAASSLRGAEKRYFEDFKFGPLPGTQQECDRLKEIFGGWHWPTEVFNGSNATKAALRQIRSPHVLHLATHGFFEPEESSGTMFREPMHGNLKRGVTRSRFFQNPMHRSGLALAGAQSTLEAWRGGQAPPVDNDGIVTAEDVSALELEGTWLVNLSACETGFGQARVGEGVLGLRRGFVEAGAQNLLLTLWPIDDQVTIRIMSDFYQAAHAGKSAAQALAEVQRDWLVRLRKEKNLAWAVNLAGAFILSAQGLP